MRRLSADLSIVCKEGKDKQLLKMADHVAQKKEDFHHLPLSWQQDLRKSKC